LKSLIYRFLILCAGSDEDVLKKCPRSEHIKHAGFGALVLVPATLGFFSMTYAISTFVDNPYLYVPAGIAWAFIVFIFDRFIVSSFRKRDSIKKDIRSVTFISRIIFSAFVGVAVAHPLVLLYFHKSIEVNMDEYAHAKTDSIEKVYTAQINSLQLKTDTLSRDLTGIYDTIHQQEGILHDEIIGAVRADSRTSGIAGEGPTFKYDTAYLGRLYSRLAAIQIANARKRADDSINILRLDSERTAKIARLTFSRDYLEREKALQRLSATNPIIRVTTWFLILFFIVVDILPVTWKGFTVKGPYDEYLGASELKIRNEVKEDILDSDTELEIHKRKKEKELETGLVSIRSVN
jgi:Domain of unknown function (DUF4407)